DEPSAPEIVLVETTPPPPPPARPSAPAVPSPRVTTERPVTPVFARGASTPARGTPAPVDTTLKTEAPSFDSSPDIEIQLELENDEAVPLPRRSARDTEMQVSRTGQTRPTLDLSLDDHTKPTLDRLNEPARRAASISDGIP